MRPFVQDRDLTLYLGDVREVLPTLEAESVDCCVTSPPYFNLRDYGSPGQIGLEASVGEYVAALVSVFAEVRRVLRPQATLWLNLGDSYAGSWGAQGHKGQMADRSVVSARQILAHPDHSTQTGSLAKYDGAKAKDMLGVPWRVAFALQQDGWYLRSDIVWSKPNPMPESVTDRPTKSHEYVFLLSKGPRYFFDQEAVREPAEWARWGDQTVPKHGGTETGAGWIKSRPKSELQRPQARRAMELFEQHGLTDDHLSAIRSVGITDTGKATVTQNGTGKNDPAVIALAQEAKDALGGYYREFLVPNGRNVRSVWEIATQPYPGAHFATFPEELPRRCIAAGCPEWVCGTCGKARERIVERSPMEVRPSARVLTRGDAVNDARTATSGTMTKPPERETVGYTDCGHGNYQPGTVLDPFFGAGTTGLVARRLGRRTVGVELNETYARMAAERLSQLSLLAEMQGAI